MTKEPVVDVYPAGEPDYAVPPGETIREFLDELGMSQRQLAVRLGLTAKHVNQLIQGLVPLSPEVAQRLELVTGMSARMWNRLEADYQSARQRLRHRGDMAELTAWLAELPVSDLVRRGDLPAEPDDPRDRVHQLLMFFGVAHVSTYRELYEAPALDFQRTKAPGARPGAVATLLRLAELKARDISCKPYSRQGLEASLDKLRQLTLQPPGVLLPLMRDICARNGVAVVIVPDFADTHVKGMTRWLSADKAMVALSTRHDSAGELWSTFFRAIHQVLKHGRSKSMVWIHDGRPGVDPREREADAFARDLLIPPDQAAALDSLDGPDEVRKFADRIGVGVSVVIVRLPGKARMRGKHTREIDFSEFCPA
ncbi:hypothetical protein Acsp04_42420 [Actinomadura sp. NBRC 104425]|uniref:HigA family addiction module antitoxin n=1 Tax=Actinomadura sp. NBRC 104425 TaxID=3032204 RepID=UPI0024A3C181|nr:HigA family addiction module antitoxin [Actinomadura sp. NBRC 104425]GLZ14007.1 hypothetical protein Acsp04_42420 [Actinomadura sp. NBRC 104425]